MSRSSAGGLPTGLPPEVVEEIDHVLSGLPDGVSCLATGSLVEGIGNANSDVDLYIVSSRDGSTTNPISIGLRESRYVDCEYLHVETVGGLVETFEKIGATELSTLSMRDFERYYRLSIAARLRVTEDLADLLDRCSRSLACRHLSRWAAERASEVLARASVALAQGRTRRAVVLTRRAADWRARSVLAEAGEGYPSEKWTEEKAERRFGKDTTEYELCLRGRAATSDDLVETVRWLRAEMDGLLRDAEPPRGRPWTLADGVVVVRQQPGVVHALVGRRRIVTVDGLAGDVLSALADGLTWPDALRRCAEELGLAGRDLPLAVSDEMERLSDAGVVGAVEPAGAVR